MKLNYIHVLFFLFFFQTSFGQENFEIQKIETTAKIWGFLKYYHPQVADGKFDWDKELIDIYPKVKTATSLDELSDIYLNWINNLGEVKTCRKCDKNLKNLFDENFDLSWMMDRGNISQSLYSVLKNIEINRFIGKPFYLSKGPDGNALMSNEVNNKIEDFPDEAHRLLGLFRYWNFVEYFFPYKYMTDKAWSEVLKDMIPKYLNVNDTLEYQQAIKQLVTYIDDSHAWIGLTDKSKLKRFPYKVKNINRQCVISGFFNEEIGKKESLVLGDVILSVNGVLVEEYIKNQLEYVPASNLNRKIVFIYENMLTVEDKTINLKIKRGNNIIETIVNLYDFSDFKYYNTNINVKWSLMENDIGYVNMRLVNKNDVVDMMKKLSKSAGIIFDMRGYPQMTFFSISGYLNSEGKPFAKAIIPEFTYPGKFVWSNIYRTEKTNNDSYKGRVLILVDEQSLSRSEFAIMCFQTTKNAITVGSQTSGADGAVSSFEYLGGFGTAMSGQGIYYPDNSPAQRVGVRIDYLVEPTIEGLTEGRDEVLEYAIKLIIKKN